MIVHRDAFYCPHGVDVIPRLRTEVASEDFTTGDIRYVYEQSECLKCVADMGHITLFNCMISEGA